MGKEEEETGGRAEDERGKGENGSEKRDGGEVEEGKARKTWGEVLLQCSSGIDALAFKGLQLICGMYTTSIISYAKNTSKHFWT